MPYIISPKQKRNIFEIVEWVKDNHKITETVTWRWGWVEVETKPNLSSYNPDKGIDIFAQFDVINHEFEDSFGEDRDFSETLSNKEIKKIQKFLEENSIIDLDQIGWNQDQDKIIFKGPLEVKKI